jgi:hypothetical protein
MAEDIANFRAFKKDYVEVVSRSLDAVQRLELGPGLTQRFQTLIAAINNVNEDNVFNGDAEVPDDPVLIQDATQALDRRLASLQPWFFERAWKHICKCARVC